MSYPSTFYHENQAVRNWIKFINENKTLDNLKRSQYFMMSGIVLNDTELMIYAISQDQRVINSPVNRGILIVVDSVLSCVTGCNLSGIALDQFTPMDIVEYNNTSKKSMHISPD